MHRSKARMCLVVLGLMLVFSLVSVAVIAETPKYGGTLVFLQAEDPGTLDFARLQATTETSVLLNIVEPLTRINPETLEVEPFLAKSWEVLDGGRTYVLHLREGVKFHNGKSMTATDVKWTLEYLNDPKFPRYETILHGIEAVDIIDEHTVSVKLNSANRIFPSHMTEICVLPNDPTIDQAVHPIGTGPFRFVEWQRAQFIKLEKFDDYWQEGLPYLDGIIFKFVPDVDAQFVQLQSGEADFMMLPAFSQFPQFEASNDIKLVTPPVPTNAYILMPNTAKGPTSDFRVRQAISYALDRKKCNEVLYGKMPVLPSTTIPPDHPLYNPHAMEFPRDVEKAKQLLAEAGYPDGLELEMAYFTVARQYELIAAVIQASLAEAGITLDMQRMEIGMFVDKVYNAREYELGLTATSLKANAFDMLSHTYAEVNGHAMFIDDTFPEITELLNCAKSAPTDEAYNQIIQDLQLIIAIKQPCITIGNMANISGARVNVKGYLQPPRPGRHWFGATWLDK